MTLVLTITPEEQAIKAKINECGHIKLQNNKSTNQQWERKACRTVEYVCKAASKDKILKSKINNSVQVSSKKEIIILKTEGRTHRVIFFSRLDIETHQEACELTNTLRNANQTERKYQFTLVRIAVFRRTRKKHWYSESMEKREAGITLEVM